eukprot:2838276-Karenia_brevis.AAC.1
MQARQLQALMVDAVELEVVVVGFLLVGPKGQRCLQTLLLSQCRCTDLQEVFGDSQPNRAQLKRALYKK